MNVKKVHSLMDRIRGAIRGFKRPSAEIGAVTFGVDIKNCAKCDKINDNSTVLYLCDGKDPRCNCGLKDKFCRRTTDISHASNFKDIGKSMDPDGYSLWVEMDEEDKEVE